MKGEEFHEFRNKKEFKGIVMKTGIFMLLKETGDF